MIRYAPMLSGVFTCQVESPGHLYDAINRLDDLFAPSRQVAYVRHDRIEILPDDPNTSHTVRIGYTVYLHHNKQ